MKEFYKISYESLDSMFRMGLCRVEFLKKNGETRVLIGTLHPHFMPVINIEDPANGRAPKALANDAQLRVYEPDVSGFRIVTVTRLTCAPVMIDVAPIEAEIEAAAACEEAYDSLEEK